MRLVRASIFCKLETWDGRNGKGIATDRHRLSHSAHQGLIHIPLHEFYVISVIAAAGHEGHQQRSLISIFKLTIICKH